MKIRLSGIKSIAIEGEYIKLDSLLKYASIVSSGAEAKHIIKSGNVFVRGDLCTERGKKIRPGDIVRYKENVLMLRRAVL